MNNFKSIALWVFILLACVFIAFQLIERPKPLELKVVEFLDIAERNFDGEARSNSAFRDVRDQAGRIDGKILLAAAKEYLPADRLQQMLKQGTQGSDGFVFFRTTYVPSQSEVILGAMREFGVKEYEGRESSGPAMTIILMVLAPIAVLVVLWLLFIRQIQSSGNKAMSFGKSKAKLVAEGQVKVTFEDVAGVEEAKEELKEVVEFLKDPKKFSRLGARIPKGVLLFGPPGTGKTMLAKAVAGEAGVPFFSISGSDFVEMFVGVGASRVRDLFETAKKNKPCLVFIDEIDAVGRHRFAGIGGGHDEREQTLNQLLVEMDGFTTNEGVILVAATNRPDVLDPALLRPGRFDRQITVDYPDIIGREAILKVHAKQIKLTPGADLKSIAKGTPGFSGADLANIVNEAALLAARDNKTAVGQRDLEEAKDRVMMGPERRSLAVSEKEKRLTAVHEAGHALAARFTEGCDPVHKITIIPRGRALGVTATLPGGNRFSYSTSELKARLVFALGGLAAEETVFGETTTGVGNDLQQVTGMARRMVCEMGMNERLGPRTFGESKNDVFLGRDMMQHTRDYSEEIAKIIDEEVKSLIDEAHSRANTIMRDQREVLTRVTDLLIERETLSGEEFELIINGEELPPLFRNNDETPSAPATDGEAETEKKKPRAPRLGDILDGPKQVPG